MTRRSINKLKTKQLKSDDEVNFKLFLNKKDTNFKRILF